MNGQAYTVRSTRNYWPWVGGAALLLVLLAVAWSTFAAPSDPPVAAVTPRAPLQQLPARKALPVQAVPASVGPAAAPAVEEAALRARIAQLESDLEAQRALVASFRDSLSLAGAQISQLSADNDRMRTAINSVVGSGAAPSRLARKSLVRHLGEPSLTPLGSAWLVSGQWLNLGNADASGTAEIQLLVDGQPTGSTQSIRIGPFAPGATAPYQVRFDPAFESQGHVVLASAHWRDD
jgi:hypothetical protein